MVKSNRDIFISLLITRVFLFEIFSSKHIKISGELYSDIITTDRISFYKLQNNYLTSISYTNSIAISIQTLFETQKNLNIEKLISNHYTNSNLYSIFIW